MCLRIKPLSFFLFRFVSILCLKPLPDPEAVDKAGPLFDHSLLSLATSFLFGFLFSFPIRLEEGEKNVFVVSRIVFNASPHL